MKKIKRKPVFVFNIHSIIDIITNSSSELFVLQGDTKKIITQLLESVYPDYLVEYDEVKSVTFLSNEELENYISWTYNTYGTNNKKDWRGVLDIFPGFTFEEMYEESYRNRDTVYYGLKKDFVENNRKKIIEHIDPEGKTWLLYSIDDNPNWECQERLSTIGTRYHLG